MIHAIGGDEPVIDPSAFVAWNAELAGDVSIGKDASIWFGAIIRADIAPVTIGEGTNLQDGVVVHVNRNQPCVVGDHVTVGHRALLHGCTVGDHSLIGMGAILLNGSEVGPGSIVGAGSLVTQGKRFPARSLVMGSPARLVRQVSDEEYEHNLANALEYVKLARGTREYRQIG